MSNLSKLIASLRPQSVAKVKTAVHQLPNKDIVFTDSTVAMPVMKLLRPVKYGDLFLVKDNKVLAYHNAGLLEGDAEDKGFGRYQDNISGLASELCEEMDVSVSCGDVCNPIISTCSPNSTIVDIVYSADGKHVTVYESLRSCNSVLWVKVVGMPKPIVWTASCGAVSNKTSLGECAEQVSWRPFHNCQCSGLKTLIITATSGAGECKATVIVSLNCVCDASGGGEDCYRTCKQLCYDKCKNSANYEQCYNDCYKYCAKGCSQTGDGGGGGLLQPCCYCGKGLQIVGLDTGLRNSQVEFSLVSDDCINDEDFVGFDWSVMAEAGSGLGNSVMSPNGVLSIGATACGSLKVTATCEACGTSAIQYVRVADAGQWVEYSMEQNPNSSPSGVCYLLVLPLSCEVISGQSKIRVHGQCAPDLPWYRGCEGGACNSCPPVGSPTYTLFMWSHTFNYKWECL